MRCVLGCVRLLFFFKDTATTEIYTLSLHDALPIQPAILDAHQPDVAGPAAGHVDDARLDRKSTRLNFSHANTSYAVFCLKKKKSGPAGSARPSGLLPPRSLAIPAHHR